MLTAANTSGNVALGVLVVGEPPTTPTNWSELNVLAELYGVAGEVKLPKFGKPASVKMVWLYVVTGGVPVTVDPEPTLFF
jgi:hypothetical protein